MARPLRIEYADALYHVMSRGNAFQDIFLDDTDRKIFLKNLKHCIELYNLVCHSYCLMDNHYHLLIETPDGNLSKAMRDINGNYTQAFNAKHQRVGHVLQGRYKAYVIEKEPYLLEVARYIVNNPVKAKMVQTPGAWKWSSYQATAGLIVSPTWLDVEWTLGLFSTDKLIARKYFQKFVEEGVDVDSPYKDLKEGIILGSPQFISWIWEKTVGSEENKEIPRTERIIGRPTLDEIFDDTMSKEERNKAIVFARYRCGYLTTEISKKVGLDRAVVGRISRGVNS